MLIAGFGMSVFDRPPEAPFVDPATGAPIHGKGSHQGQVRPSEPSPPKANLLDPDNLEDTFERQESRMPCIAEQDQKILPSSE
ncbi:hypothetical protein cyc_05316 [Cyclospora cayetanensis]|uniref:Uncharacterized protein n=1 Tax=Cyclospora cayetanensis TaxID=88456 RepID=A0A1D3D0Y0_9EIME|nr:hypothetical protein cyc_05316 [Cyclospora cayetanensis]